MYTAIDAYSAKRSATSLGYYEDKYLDHMQYNNGKTVRKQPIINRGYYTRVACFRNTIQKFLEVTESSGPRQIVNLGCGFDTLSFHLIDEGHDMFTIFEVDYEDIILKKVDLIRRSVELNKLLDDSGNHFGPNYGFDCQKVKYVAADLLQSNVTDLIVAAGLDSNQPTLIISECVLVYLDAASVTALGSSLLSYLANASTAWISYDMFNPMDAFGKMMRANIESSAGYKIPGFTDFPTLESHQTKFVNVGFPADSTKVCNMLDAYNFIFDNEEKSRLQSIERLDEIEEWEMLMSHYCLCLGIKSGDNVFVSVLDRKSVV